MEGSFKIIGDIITKTVALIRENLTWQTYLHFFRKADLNIFRLLNMCFNRKYRDYIKVTILFYSFIFYFNIIIIIAQEGGGLEYSGLNVTIFTETFLKLSLALFLNYLLIIYIFLK